MIIKENFGDIVDVQAVGLPVFATGLTPVSARGQLVEVSMGESIVCQGAKVSLSDVAVADATGVAFVPSSVLEEVVSVAAKMSRLEERLRVEIHSGLALSKVLDHRYEVARVPTSQVPGIRG